MFCGNCIYFRPYPTDKHFPRLGYCADQEFLTRILENSKKCPSFKKIIK